MDTVTTVRIFFNPLNADSKVEYQIEPGAQLIDFLQEHYPVGFNGVLRVLVGTEELALENLDYAVREGEQVTMLVMPSGAVGAYIAANWVSILVSTLVSTAIGLVIGLLFRPSRPDGLSGDEESPVYSINATRNSARLGEPVPVHYGSVSYPPDFAAAPYIFYNEASNDMYVDELLCLGHGEFTIDDIYIGDTPIAELEPGTVWWWVYGPGDHGSRLGVIEADIWDKVKDGSHPIPFYENVFTSPEVENWEFGHDSGEVFTTWSAISGNAVARGVYAPTGEELPGRINSVPDTVDISPGDMLELQNTTSNNVSFEVDAVVPGSPGFVTVFERYKDDIISDEAPLNGAAEYRVNNAGSGMVAGPFRAQKLGQEVDQIDCDIIFPGGLYRISSSGNIRKRDVDMQFTYQQIDESDGSPIGAPIAQTVNFEAHQRNPYRATVSSGPLTAGAYEVTVERLTAVEDDANKQDTVTWAGLKGHVVLDTTAEAYGAVTLLAIRMRATNGLGAAARSRVRVTCSRVIDGVDSSNPATVVKDIWTNPAYGMGKDLAELDTATIDALETLYNDNSVAFNGSFDQRGTGWEAMESVASMCAAKIVHQNALVTMVQDRVQAARTAMFSSANIVRDTFQVLYTFDTEGDFDGVKVEYRDPTTFDPKYVTYPADAVSPENFTLFGCTDETYAGQYAVYLWNVKSTRRKVTQFETELEGLIPMFGDRIGISHPMPDWGQSGVFVERIGPLSWRVDQALDWQGNDKIILRDNQGAPTDALDVTMGATRDVVVFGSAPTITIYEPTGREPTSYSFGRNYELIKDFIVSRIDPQTEDGITIEGHVYDESIFTGAPPHMGVI